MNYILSALIAALTLNITAPLTVPLAEPLRAAADPFVAPVDAMFDVPDGALPWSLPRLPVPSVVPSTPEIDLEAVEHTANYDTNAAALQANLDEITAQVNTVSTFLESYLTDSEISPDLATATGDLSTGMAPMGSSMTAYQMADQVGQSIETTITWSRVVLSFNIGSSQNVYTIILINIALIVFVNIMRFVGQAADWVISLTEKLANIVNLFIPG